MHRARRSSKRIVRLSCVLGATLVLLGSTAAPARAADFRNLPVVKPVVSCEQLATADLGRAVGSAVTIKAAAEVDTGKGTFCRVTGTIAPAVGFEVDLPIEHWTQRYFQAGCGGMCGDVHVNVGNAGTCAPALNGEFVVAADDMGHSGGMGPGAGPAGSFGADADARIDFAYRANHETTLAAKALIRVFYGQPQKYSYFAGCSDGGREALAEAQRYPDDFDGISAGAPVLLINLHNSFFHGWEGVINRRADGSPILLRSRARVLHDAILAHCPTLSGVQDGLLEDPVGSCRFDPAWVRCKAGGTGTSTCLTAEETAVAQKYYDGPHDSQGHSFEIHGYPLGSELMWPLPGGGTGDQGGPGGGGMAAGNIKYLLMPTVLTDEELARFSYTQEWFEKVSAVGAPLYNAANTNLRPFQAHGGKLIVWHGLADTSQQPASTIAYYQGVQKLLGEKDTDSFMRLFLIPGVGHCGGGDGFPQIDTLTPLMAWTETQQAPAMLVAGRTAGGQMGPGGRAERGGPGGQAGRPYAEPAQPTVATRPVYPWPYVAKYKGTGDPKDAANYEPVRVPETLPLVFNSEALKLIGPDNSTFFHAEHGVVAVDLKK